MRILIGTALAVVLMTSAAFSETIGMPEAPGYAQKDASGKYQGIAVDLTDEVEKRSGVALERKFEPGGRALSGFMEGNTDFFIFVYDERMSEYGEILSKTGSIALMSARPKDQPQIKTFEDLYAFEKNGIVRNAIPVGRIVEDEKLKRVEVSDSETGIKMLLAGRLDTMNASKVGLLTALKHLNVVDQVNMGKVGVMEFAMYAGKKVAGTETKEKVKTAIVSMVNDGAIDAVLDKHFGPDWRHPDN